MLRRKDNSISSANTSSRTGNSQDDAALERYLQEQDLYKEFLINGTRKNSTANQPRKKEQPLNEAGNHSGAGKNGDGMPICSLKCEF